MHGPAVDATSASVDDVRDVAIERRRDALPSPSPRAELARVLGARLARARTIAPVTIPVAARWIARRTVRLLPSGGFMPSRPSRGTPAALVIRWGEATIYGPDEHRRLERRSFGVSFTSTGGRVTRTIVLEPFRGRADTKTVAECAHRCCPRSGRTIQGWTHPRTSCSSWAGEEETDRSPDHRLTGVFEHRGDRWLIAQLHVSWPSNVD